MKQWIFLLALLLPFSGMAQHKWSVLHGGKSLLKMVEENPGRAPLQLSRTSLQKTGSLIILFDKEDTKVFRTVGVSDETGQGLQSWEKTGRRIRIPHADLLRWLEKHPVIRIHYMDIPRDPALAAVVRVRMIEICSFRLR
jgi:hypothetical protein